MKEILFDIKLKFHIQNVKFNYKRYCLNRIFLRCQQIFKVLISFKKASLKIIYKYIE